ncbi:MAG TPA: GFA family protein [Xanthobacteraceae bacterium]|nr:GFA family protein [Xanthobacteraceae bacterium]
MSDGKLDRGHLTGGCLCGAVRYEVSERPRATLSCHCRDCQYVSGGASAHAMIVGADDVAITEGKPKEHWTVSAKGNRMARLFCGTCGTPLFVKNEAHPEILQVKAGSLDDTSQFWMQANAWVSSAPPWHHIDAEVMRFPRDPEMGLKAFLELARSSIVKLGRATGISDRDTA